MTRTNSSLSNSSPPRPSHSPLDLGNVGNVQRTQAMPPKGGLGSNSSSEAGSPSRQPRPSNRPAFANQLVAQLRSQSAGKEGASGIASTEAISSSSVTSGDVTVRLATVEDNEKVNKFIENLDDDTYELRFGDLEPEHLHDFLKTYKEAFAVFLAEKEGEVVGMTDCLPAQDYDSKTVCAVNIVVASAWQGNRIGKKLIDDRDEHLRAEGYRHKVEIVYRYNTEHIETLLGKGWNETTSPDSPVDEDDDTRQFWTALDPQFQGEEPKLRGQ